MVGVIRKRDVLSHPLVTIRCFGWRVFIKTLVAGRRQTFLALLMEADVLEVRGAPAPRTVERCIQLESRAARLYDQLAARFAGDAVAQRFFAALAEQERQHAELLELCRAAASHERWDTERLDPWTEAVPKLEKQMEEAEGLINQIGEVADALRLVIQIESSEVNRVFQSIVAATDSDFVRALSAFRMATESHISYICRRVPEIEPRLGGPCRDLESAFSSPSGGVDGSRN